MNLRFGMRCGVRGLGFYPTRLAFDGNANQIGVYAESPEEGAVFVPLTVIASFDALALATDSPLSLVEQAEQLAASAS